MRVSLRGLISALHVHTGKTTVVEYDYYIKIFYKWFILNIYYKNKPQTSDYIKESEEISSVCIIHCRPVLERLTGKR